jgi:hypothetical protein
MILILIFCVTCLNEVRMILGYMYVLLYAVVKLCEKMGILSKVGRLSVEVKVNRVIV